MSWWAIAVLATGTYAMKAAGPLVLGSRTLHPALQRISALLAATLLAALIALSTFADGDRLRADGPLIAAMVSAAVVVRLRAPFAVVVIVAAGVAAALRAMV